MPKNNLVSITIDERKQGTQPGPQPAPLGVNTIPTGPAIQMATKSIIYADDLPRLARQEKQISKGIKKIEYSADSIAFTKALGQDREQIISIKLLNIDRLTSEGTNALKLFLYAFDQINKQAVFNGKLVKNEISLSVNELVRDGIYKSPAYARKVLKKAGAALGDIKILGETYTGKKLNQQTTITIFPTIYNKIASGSLTLKISDDITWDFFAIGYTAFPKELYKLKGRPFTLAYYIQTLARQNCRKIRDTGGFNLSLQAVHNYLRLPPVSETKNARRDIITPIEDAIREIEAALQGQIDIDVCNANETNINEYIKGNLNIIFSGDLLAYFSGLANTRGEQIEQAKKRKERIETKAKALAYKEMKKADRGTNPGPDPPAQE